MHHDSLRPDTFDYQGAGGLASHAGMPPVHPRDLAEPGIGVLAREEGVPDRKAIAIF
jgi:hypothetical protein